MRIAPLVLLMLLAGCIDSKPTEAAEVVGGVPLVAEQKAGEVVGAEWSARYIAGDGQTLHLSMGPAQPTLSPAGDHLLLAPLHAEYSEGFPPAIHWIDAQLRAVRVDYPCGGRHPSEGECGGPTVDWSYAGAYAPYGVGWPAMLLANGTMPLPIGMKMLFVDFERTGRDGKTTWAPGPDWLPGYVHRDFTSEATYVGQSLIPSELEVREASWKRTSFQTGNPLPALDSWRPALKSVSAVPYLLPASGQDVLGGGMSIRQAFKHLQENVPEARDALASGCLGAIQQYVAVPSDPGVGAPIWGDGTYVQTTFHIASGDDWIAWHVDWYPNPGPVMSEWRYGNEDSDFPRECFDPAVTGRDVSLERVEALVRLVAPNAPIADVHAIPRSSTETPDWARSVEPYYSVHSVNVGISTGSEGGVMILPPQVSITRETGWLGFAILPPDAYPIP